MTRKKMREMRGCLTPDVGAKKTVGFNPEEEAQQ